MIVILRGSNVKHFSPEKGVRASLRQAASYEL
jgi:hypothetical protein